MSQTYPSMPMPTQVGRPMAPPPTPRSILEESPVQVMNPTDRHFVLPWDGIKYRVPPHGQALIPFMAMVRMVGNPNLVGPARQEEWMRLRIKHNIGTIDNPSPIADYPLEFYSIVDQSRITTVLDDPEGEHLMPTMATNDQTKYLMDTVANLTKQLENVQRLLDPQIRQSISQEMGIDTVPDTAPPPPFDRSDPGASLPIGAAIPEGGAMPVDGNLIPTAEEVGGDAPVSEDAPPAGTVKVTGQPKRSGR